ncbi:MAG: restriction endonuclease subunit S, partial [Gaiellaceae bacterium]
LYLLMHYAASRAFDRYVTGSTIAHLPQEDLRRLPVPVPPLAEQRRIVAAIEEQLSRLDAATSAAQAVRARLDQLRSLVLRRAFPSDADSRDVAELAEVGGGKTPKGLQGREGGTIPFYKVGDMNAAVGGQMGPARTYLDAAAIDEYRLTLWPPGTVIFPKQGGAIATNKKRVLAQPAACDLNTMGVIPGPELRSRFLRLWFDTINLEALSDGSVVAQIKPSSVERLRVPQLTLEQQDALADRVEEQLEAVQRLAIATDAATNRGRALRRAILASAFRGELVPQDPDDESASVLLEGIAAERAAAPTPARRGHATMAK